MEEITITKVNESNFRITADTGTLQEIKEYFTFAVPGAKYSPKFKMRIWDGKISLLNLNTRTMYMGLISKLLDFCTDRGYKPILSPDMFFKNKVDAKEVIEFVNTLNIHSDGNPIKIRDYQYAAIYAGILNKRRTLLSPTASGKSLIIYCIIQWILKKDKGSVLLLVPTVGLVGQMESDFLDYSNGTFTVQTISDGASKIVSNSVVVSTWQSVFKQTGKWFNQFDGIIVDEVHTAQANSIRGIMESATDVHYRIGLTGTLSGSKTHELVISGLFGKISQITTTAKLIEDGHTADIDIRCLVLEYQDKEEQKLIKGADYPGEVAYLCTSEKRNNLIAKIAVKSTGNTLVLYNNIIHGDLLYVAINDLLPEGSLRKVFLINGSVSGDDRNNIRAIVEKEGLNAVELYFGDQSIILKHSDNVLLVSGDVKIAEKITEDDDIDTTFLLNNGINIPLIQQL